MNTTKTDIETNMDKSHKNMTYHAKKPPKYADESKEEGDDRHVESCGDQSSRHWQATRASV